MPSNIAGRAEILAQPLSVIAVDALVFLFQRNRQGQNLTFRETVEFPHTFLRMSMQGVRCDCHCIFYPGRIQIRRNPYSRVK